MMKQMLKHAIAVAIILSMAVPAFAAPGDEDTELLFSPLSTKFSDINTDDYAWARPYIDPMAEAGYISGYEDNTYRPDNDVTRLEAISLFARAMGSSDKANSSILALAHEKYDDMLAEYDLGWGLNDVAYMVYKGALSKSDLDKFLSGEEKNTPMQRYESAIVITKAMGAEKKALSELGVVLNYNDAREVPSSAIQYVSYVTDQNIMEGMGDGIFSPRTTVKRSQMAVMLSKAVEKMGYTFTEATVDNVDSSTREISFTDKAGEPLKYSYNDDTVFMITGDAAQAKDFTSGMNIVATTSGDRLVSVESFDTKSSAPSSTPSKSDTEIGRKSETITGKYVSYSSNEGNTSIRITPDNETEPVSYKVNNEVSVIYAGESATIRSFAKGDMVTLELVDGKVVKVTGGSKTETITNATVEDISVSDNVSITISHANNNYNGKTYKVSSNVNVRKNETPAELDSIYKGDTVNLTLEYGEITKIVATSTRKVFEGTISSLTIASPNSTMKVKIKGEEMEFTIPKDVSITINGKEGTLYDFRVGDSVKITTDSDAIKRIVATSTEESTGSIVGVVANINTSYGVISIKPDGSEDTKQVFCKDDSTMFVTSGGKTKKMKDIKVGQTVEAKGVVSNGVFVGTLLIVLSE